jgi:hypothetical protein
MKPEYRCREFQSVMLAQRVDGRIVRGRSRSMNEHATVIEWSDAQDVDVGVSSAR